MKQLLHYISFRELSIWSAGFSLKQNFGFKDSFDFVSIKDILKKKTEVVKIQDDILYQRVTVKVRNNGIEERDKETGKNIGTKRQFKIHTGQFLLSKIDARNGSMGIVPKELDGAVVTQDFLPYEIDTTKVNPDFFVLLTTTKTFIDFCQRCSSGTTNRQRIDETAFLNVQIPLPSIHEQDKIVNAYKHRIKLAEIDEMEFVRLENEIDDILYKELGLKKLEVQPLKKRTLNIFSYSDIIDRWDFYNSSQTVFSSLSKGKYLPVELGKVYNFVNRSWNKRIFNKEYFRYVEIGAIDPSLGILEAVTLDVKNAPSRATQTISTNDLIIGTTRPYLKKFAVVNSDFNECVCSSGFQVISPSDKYNIFFLLEYLKSDLAIKQFEFFMTGALYPAITGKDLRRILIPLPPLNIQNKIADKFSNMKLKIKQLKQQAEQNRISALQEFENEIFKN